ncbi:MAG TPA: hypothetical protein IAA52_00545 [Candidatus Pullichristensenella stercorigallinarum]|uniref:Uncharacterized protein n=1 Tax=Candidatus Pullichristensenella stercorigallinarum TaxID=2840909 RepID=A0A9D1CVU3_9FIRM|nr:hypothetical protein [Candidatus Pullichristensenella stercorigallinarum]
MKKCLSALLALLALALPLGAVAQELEVMVIDGAAAPVEEQQLTAESAIRIPDDCIIDGPWARWYSDKAISQGSGFVYLDTQENGAESLRWDFPVDTHTPLLVKMNFTNMSHEETKLLSRVSCEVIYDDKYIFETTPMQVNPEQTDAEGVTGASASIDGTPLPPLFGTELRFYTNVPKLVRDSDAPLIARVTLDDSTVFTIDVRSVVETYNGEE